jgi:nicotinamidase/pyrazinamidase
MLSRSLVFADIDTQRDFMEPTGALYVPDAERIHTQLAHLTQCAREQGIPVLATACAHTLDEPDPEPFPPHCLVGTKGQERIEATAWPGSVVVPPDGVAPPARPPHLTLEKRKYDFFSHTDVDAVLALYTKEKPTFVVYGVATDYCVRCAVEGLLARGQRVALVIDAVRPIDRSGEPDLLTEFARRGVLLTITEKVCQWARGG